MNIKLPFIILLIFSLQHYIAFGQTDSSVHLAGVIMEADNDSLVLPYAHVVNLNTQVGTISDAEGIFMLVANFGDSIQFSSVGYQNLTYIVHTTQFIKVKMIIDVHILPEQIILPYLNLLIH